MPLVIVARVGAKGEFEVLLQKRHDWLKDPLLWNVPAGSASSDEERVRRDGSTPPELRARIERRSALRELIEEAGGGACSTARAVPHRLEALPGGVAAVSYPPVILPPNLLRMEEDVSVVRKLGGGAGNFVYLINPKTEEVWARQWQPRALPRWRDEVYEKAGKWGYAWRPLGCLKASLDLPVPGDDKPLVEWVAKHIRGDGLEILLRDLAREAGHGAAPPAAKVRGVLGKKAAGEFSPRSPRDAAAAAFIGGTAGACPPDTPHYCKFCQNRDSSHFSAHCPESKVFYFIRHGQSTANAEPGCVPNRNPDALLTPLGTAQAIALQSETTKWGAELVVCSPLRRAMQTAHLAFYGQNLRLLIEPSVREMNGSDADNRGRVGSTIEQFLHFSISTAIPPFFSPDNVRAIDAGAHLLWNPALEAEAVRHGQPAYDCDAVISGAIDALLQLLGSKRVAAVVTHWGCLARLFGIDTPNCGVVRVVVHPASRRWGRYDEMWKAASGPGAEGVLLA